MSDDPKRSDEERSARDADDTGGGDAGGSDADDDILGDAIDRAEPTPNDQSTTDTSPEQMSDQPATDTQTGAQPSDQSPDGGESTVRRYVNYAILAVLLLLAFVAVVQFYLATGSAINTWITPEYRSLFRALFNLAVLLAVGAGVAYQLRRMDLGGSGED